MSFYFPTLDEQSRHTIFPGVMIRTASAERAYGEPYKNAYTEIRRVLERHGFTWQQGSVYFGDQRINAVTCVLAAIDLARSLPWFAAAVRDIHMLRIEEMNDLMPAVQQADPES